MGLEESNTGIDLERNNRDFKHSSSPHVDLLTAGMDFWFWDWTSLKAGERSDIIYKEKDSNASSYGTSGLVELKKEYHNQLNQEPPLERELNPILLYFLFPKASSLFPTRNQKKKCHHQWAHSQVHRSRVIWSDPSSNLKGGKKLVEDWVISFRTIGQVIEILSFVVDCKRKAGPWRTYQWVPPLF